MVSESLNACLKPRKVFHTAMCWFSANNHDVFAACSGDKPFAYKLQLCAAEFSDKKVCEISLHVVFVALWCSLNVLAVDYVDQLFYYSDPPCR